MKRSTKTHFPRVARCLRMVALRLDPGVVSAEPFRRVGEPAGAEYTTSTILHESYQAHFVLPRGRVLVWTPHPLSREEWSRVRALLMENRWVTESDLTYRLIQMLGKEAGAEWEGRNWSQKVSFPVSR
jgi:hypothetical protein